MVNTPTLPKIPLTIYTSPSHTSVTCPRLVHTHPHTPCLGPVHTPFQSHHTALAQTRRPCHYRPPPLPGRANRAPSHPSVRVTCTTAACAQYTIAPSDAKMRWASRAVSGKLSGELRRRCRASCDPARRRRGTPAVG